MNALRLLLCALMLLFVAVQYNDPDGPLWALVYTLPAVAMAIGVGRPGWLRGRAGRILLTVTLVGLAVATVLTWPEAPGFWRREVWWEQETVREGLGLLIALLVTAVALPIAWPPPPWPVRRRGRSQRG